MAPAPPWPGTGAICLAGPVDGDSEVRRFGEVAIQLGRGRDAVEQHRRALEAEAERQRKAAEEKEQATP